MYLNEAHMCNLENAVACLLAEQEAPLLSLTSTLSGDKHSDWIQPRNYRIFLWNAFGSTWPRFGHSKLLPLFAVTKSQLTGFPSKCGTVTDFFGREDQGTLLAGFGQCYRVPPSRWKFHCGTPLKIRLPVECRPNYSERHINQDLDRISWTN